MKHLPRPIEHIHRFNHYKWLKFIVADDDLEMIAGFYGVETKLLQDIEFQFQQVVDDLSKDIPKQYKKTPLEKTRDILTIGDSITSDRESYVHILQRFWIDDPSRNIEESAVSGDTTLHLLRRYYISIENRDFDQAILFIGTNDCCMTGDEANLPIVGFEDYSRNIQYLCSHLEKKCGKNIIITTIPPVDNVRFEQHIAPNKGKYDPVYIAKINDFLRKISLSAGYKTADLAAALYEEPNEYLRDDGIHLNGRGQLIMARLLAEILP